MKKERFWPIIVLVLMAGLVLLWKRPAANDNWVTHDFPSGIHFQLPRDFVEKRQNDSRREYTSTRGEVTVRLIKQTDVPNPDQIIDRKNIIVAGEQAVELVYNQTDSGQTCMMIDDVIRINETEALLLHFRDCHVPGALSIFIVDPALRERLLSTVVIDQAS